MSSRAAFLKDLPEVYRTCGDPAIYIHREEPMAENSVEKIGNSNSGELEILRWRHASSIKLNWDKQQARNPGLRIIARPTTGWPSR